MANAKPVRLGPDVSKLAAQKMAEKASEATSTTAVGGSGTPGPERKMLPKGEEVVAINGEKFVRSNH